MPAAAHLDMKDFLVTRGMRILGSSRRMLGVSKTSYGKLSLQGRGFTLLMAMLVASIVLSMGASIYTIVSEEVNFVGLGRDSRMAFLAAIRVPSARCIGTLGKLLRDDNTVGSHTQVCRPEPGGHLF